jgi:uncharacterized protein with PIN domain
VSKRKGDDFSRIHPSPASTGPQGVAPHDSEGRRALFSAGEELPEEASAGLVTISCGHCGEESALTPKQALRLSVPSLHLPYLKRGHGSWMRCPACRRHTWVSVQIHLP